jgi:hypothetical protein
MFVYVLLIEVELLMAIVCVVVILHGRAPSTMVPNHANFHRPSLPLLAFH